jgi:hypothetical protein
MKVRSHCKDFVWYSLWLVTQHTIADSCVPSTLMCEVAPNVVEGCCVFVLKAQFHVLGTMTG